MPHENEGRGQGFASIKKGKAEDCQLVTETQEAWSVVSGGAGTVEWGISTA